MKEKYWITQDYTCTINNTHNKYIKTKLKSVVIFSFSLLFKGNLPWNHALSYSYKNMQKEANARATCAILCIINI